MSTLTETVAAESQRHVGHKIGGHRRKWGNGQAPPMLTSNS